MNRPTPHQTQLLHSLKGAAASIVILLIFHPGIYTNKELQLSTGYSDKSIALAVDKLTAFGLIEHSGRGWQIASGISQLPLFPHNLLAGNASAGWGHPAGNASAGVIEAGATADTENFRHHGEFPTISAPSSSCNTNTLKVNLESSFATLSGYAADNSTYQQEVDNKKRGGATRKISVSTAAESDYPEQLAEFRRRYCTAPHLEVMWLMLTDAGVGRLSHKMAELLTRNINLHQAAWHCAAVRLAQRDGAPDYPVNWLIARLLAGTGAPCPYWQRLWELNHYCPDMLNQRDRLEFERRFAHIIQQER